MRVLPFALAAAVLLASPVTAFAQPKKPAAGKTDPKLVEAKKLFDDGAAAYTQGNYETAIDAFQKAYEISKKPLIFESIANAYERLGQAKKAREYLGKWREVAPKDEQELLDARLKNLDARVAREDELDTARKAEEAKAKAAEEARKSQVAAPAEREGTYLPGVVLLGGGAAAVAVGITLDVIASIQRPDKATACAASGAMTICKASAKDAIGSSSTLALAGDILWIAGAAASAGGLALVITHKSSHPKDAAPPAATYLAPAGAGLVVGGTF